MSTFCFILPFRIIITVNNECGTHLGVAPFDILRSQTRRLFEAGAQTSKYGDVVNRTVNEWFIHVNPASYNL
jgi:hypothetical protein